MRKTKDFIKTAKFIFEFNFKLIQKGLMIIFRKKNKLDFEIMRLENIAAAHISILRKALKRNCSVLILEDDFQINSGISNSDIYEILTCLSKKKKWITVNLSLSYSDEELAIKSLRKGKNHSVSYREFRMYEYSFPVVNTACALYYHQDFLEEILVELKRLENAKFIPIDHKINIALLNITRKNEKICYLSLDPGLFLQRSLHANLHQFNIITK